MVTFLITGGAGHIGSYLSSELVKNGYNVVVLDNLSSGCITAVDKGAIFYEGSIGDKELLKQIFKTHEIDLVFHLAISDIDKHIDSSSLHKRSLMNSLTLINEMKRAKVSKIIFSSTASIYGSSRHSSSLLESTEPNPETVYAKCMLEIENQITNCGLAYIIFRYFNAAGKPKIGVDSGRQTLIPTLLHKVREKDTEFTVFGTGFETKDGSCVRDFIHVNDIISAHFLGAERLVARNVDTVINLGTGKGHSVLEVVNMVERLTNHKFSISYSRKRPGDPIESVASFMVAYNLLGWYPTYDLEEIIQDEAGR